MLIRNAAAIGFYPGEKEELVASIEQCFNQGPGGIPEVGAWLDKVVGGIVPHAGYIYSGSVAAYTYAALAKKGAPDVVCLLGTSHTGYPAIGLMSHGIWRTPLGDIEVDREFSNLILKNTEIILDDTDQFLEYPHNQEHNLEVQLPFLQYLFKNFKIVPITIPPTDAQSIREAGISIAAAMQQTSKKISVIASTDMTHYGAQSYGFAPVGSAPIEKIIAFIKKTDGEIIDHITKFDYKAVLQAANHTTMCGPGSVATLLVVAKELGANEVKIQKYTTSYDITGETEAIVGYLSAIVL
ncbi:MAG: AmmeMemoRadiSam system protein B [Candidatus Helarchaeota archaeon]|nr:AmmeMemoRadiSam system protein B [Candidatus Helarchaeota archaeon]